jgi:AcrR family transcriptional regulator
MNTEITERQQQIINVSLELIAESGIQSLTIKNLAKKIGFAESAIYRHYENKVQILLAILDFFKQYTESFFLNELNASDTAINKIDHLFTNHFKKFAASPSLVAVIFSEEIFRNEKELSEKVSEIVNKNSLVLKTIIETGQKKGEIRNDVEASHLSVMIMGSLRMFVKQWQMSGNQFNLVENGSVFIDSIKRVIKV